ncbi:MAG: HlyD family type I secretion periplasmic adaptor subunit [Halieaceae bacterium]|jgi:membrane fusion protein, adhesin transport system|nr:HlyD family type I secretion periplasmic adaptor subunit [Halieaceae bacterium]
MTQTNNPDTAPAADDKSPRGGGRLPWTKDESEPGYDWQQNAHKAFLDQQPLRARALLYGIVVTFVGLLGWASVAEIDEVKQGSGTVIPSRQVQMIQSQDGGVVTGILVREGDIVKKGQLLVRLDQTRSAATLRGNRGEYQALAVKAARLRAAVDKTEFEPDNDMLEAVPLIVTQELALFESRKTELSLETKIAEQELIQSREGLSEVSAKVRQLKRSLTLTNQELELTRPMVTSGAVSAVEILRLEREANQLSGQHEQSVAQQSRLKSAINAAEHKLQEVGLIFSTKARTELSSTLARMNALRESGTGLSDRVKQNSIKSPVNGTIKQVHFNTIGGVVLPGRDIIEVVPLDDTLLVEVKIRPKDIAFLVIGQKAQVKITAYDFVTYGNLEGEVEQIGADTIMDATGNPFYKIKVRTRESNLRGSLPIIPGMTVDVDIITSKKTILAYLLRPILRAKML